MKHFTPGLLARFGSPDDAVADAAQSEWEAVALEYRRRFRSLRDRLPRRFRTLLRRHQLHDAAVRFLGVDGRILHLTLELDAPPHDTLFLRYRLEADVRVATRATDPAAPMHWLYDEVDLVDGADPVVEQSILFSNGLELAIRFRDMQFSKARTLALVGA